MNPRDIEDIYDLSPIQHGLLYETVRSPGTGVYVEQMSIHLDGELDLNAFERAWQRVVERHPILRTGFIWQESGVPLQVVHRRAAVTVERLDWSYLDETAFDEVYAAWLREDRLAGFELDRPPLMRLTVIRRTERRFVFAWRFSHLAMDGWSFGIAIMDWLAHYRAERHGTPPPAAAARPYRDYVAWWRAHPAGEAERDYWRAELEGHRPDEPLRIEGDAGAGTGEPTHGYVHAELGELGSLITRMAHAEHLTVNTVVQGAWSLLLGRYRATDDVIAGGTVAHRPRDLPGAETILGPLIVTLPLRVRVDPRRPVAEWLGELQQHQAAARERATVPLAEIQRLAGTLGPLLETSVSYENVPLPETALEDVGLHLAGYAYDGRPHFPLTLVILPGEEMPLRLVYDRRRFSAAAAAQLVDQLRELLRSIAADPGAPLGELDMRTPEERAAFEAEAARPLPGAGAATVLDRFLERAAEHPHATAVTCAGERLSYGELERGSGRVAVALAARGVDRGDRVGLAVGRSVELITAMVGILRAGAAYVPFDPEYPAARLELLAADSAPKAVVTTAELRRRLPVLRELGGVLCLEDCHGEGELPAPPRPDDDIYLLYTSGSTGRPKGVPIRHEDVAAMLGACEEQLEPVRSDVWEMFHSYGFDVSVLEVWGALATGGRLAVVPAAALRSAQALVRLAREEGVTITNQTPSAFELFAAAEAGEAEGAAPLALRWVILAGERLDPARLREWVRRHGDAKPVIVNMFGITETTVVSTWRRIHADDVEGATGSPIGRPLRHQRLYLLDERRRPVPRGVRGELYLGGHALARGYRGREELSAERFLPDPFAGGDARMYRTGDTARQCADGAFEYIGRTDDQVQIRGFRVEPAEVEAALRELDGVRQAAVVARPDARGETALVAYVAGEVGTAARERLAERLPVFMLPSAVVVLDELPRNASGKTDRRALPDPALLDDERLVPVAPRDAAEAALLEVVATVLGNDRIGVLDDLAARGMHSLAAMRIAVQARRRLGVELHPRELFGGATVASLAAATEIPEQLHAAR